MTLLLMLLVKSLLVFAVAGLLLFALRRSSAATRYLVCLLTLCSVLLLPLCSLTLPGWQVAALSSTDQLPPPAYQEPTPVRSSPALPVREGKEFEQEAHLASAASSSASSLAGRTPAKQGGGFLMQGGRFLALYLLGVVLAGLRPLLGLWGIAHLRRACAPITDAPTLSVSADSAAALHLKRLPLLCRADVPVPMTWGVRRPVVLLPSGSDTWPEDRLRSVLLHEMAHIKRRDWPCHRLADAACALYWFHPLVWLTARRLRAESEVACDDLVLSSGIPAPDYARHLLEIAGSLFRPLPPRAVIAMAQTPHIKRRILMVLDKTRQRTLPRRAFVLGIALTAAALVPLAMLRPAAEAQNAPPSASAAQQQKAHRQALARVSAVHAVPGEFDAYQLTQEGQALTPQAAAALERKLAGQPDDYTAHLMLLGYYETKQFTPGSAKAAYQQQVFWLIQNHPESVLFSMGGISLLKRSSSAAFEEGKALWLEQVAKQPKNAKILGNAATYCLLSDDATSEKLLRQAEALEPKSSVWTDKLGELYRLEGEGPDPSPTILRQSAKKALAEYELSAMLANHTSQPSTSPDLAKTAFDAGEYDKAKQYASDLLQRSQNQQPNGHDPNDDRHAANLVLGLLALRGGDTAGAEAHLLAMGRVSGSPVLDSFGPNMRLAKELLAQGDSQPVLAYLNECTKFWTYQPGKVSLATWAADVKQGKMPNFGSNLVY